MSRRGRRSWAVRKSATLFRISAGGVRGNKIEVLFQDNQAKPDQSVLSFNKLVDLQHVPMVFTAYSGPSLAMAPLATRKKNPNHGFSVTAKRR